MSRWQTVSGDGLRPVSAKGSRRRREFFLAFLLLAVAWGIRPDSLADSSLWGAEILSSPVATFGSAAPSTAVASAGTAAPLTATYGVAPTTVFDPSATATTSAGGGTFDLNAFLGADRYYHHSTPITGQNSISTNLEAGHVWNGHETLTHVTHFTNSTDTWGSGLVAPLYDRHATWAAMLIGGRQTAVAPHIRQQGIAPGTDLRSAAVATGWSGPVYATSFGISPDSYITAYAGSFGTADVVNSSYGYPDPGGAGTFTVFTDAMSFQNPGTLHVVSAGNEGFFGNNTVGAPGSGYNTLTVGALGSANGFDTVAGFSSRSPQDFSYYSDAEWVTVAGVRAAVDLAAPGESLTSAFYGGQNGGNNASLAGTVDLGSDPAAYTASIAGTSFAAPLVAGGAALVTSAAKTLAPLLTNADATQSVVVKSLLLTGADKTSGWDNGQQAVTRDGRTFIETTQSLDWAAGAGRMNLDTTFDIQVNGTADVAGTGTGLLAPVTMRGWDFGRAVVGTANDYVIATELAPGTITTTLSWMRARAWDDSTGDLYEIAQANLDLSVWALDENDAFTTLIGRSASLYNTVEHLSFQLPAWGRYGLRVEYSSNTFDNTLEDVWGAQAYSQDYGLAWIAVPEPSALLLAGIGIASGAWLSRRRLRRKPRSPAGFEGHAPLVGDR